MIPRLAVLAGVPTERAAFIRAALDPGRDFARRFAGDPIAAWEGSDGYAQRVAAPVQAWLAHARSLGALVHEQGGLAEFAEATARCEVVVVLAHWKAARVTRDDLPAGDGRAIAAAVRAQHPALAQCIEHVPADDLDAVAALLDEHVHRPAPAPLIDHAQSFASVAHPDILAAEQRMALEAQLGRLLRPGNRLELADDLHAMQPVEQAIAPGFSGVIDLTNCSSSVLANHIDHQRGGACRIVQFTSLLEPETTCLALQQTLALLEGNAAADYLSARARAFDDVHAALASEAHRDERGWWRRFWPAP